jgi:Protein of unknown function (DUF3443)/Kelch motif
MNRSRLVLLLTGLAILIGGAAITPAPKAWAAAVKAKLMFRQSPLNMGLVRPGFTSTATEQVFNASGIVPAAIATATIASPFKISSNQCEGVTLQPAQGCSIVLLFSPTKKGKFSQPLKVTVTGEKTVFKMSVSGSGSLTAGTPTPSPTPTPTPSTTPTPTPAPTIAPTAAGDVFLLGGYAALPVIYDPAAATANTSGTFDAFAGGVGSGLLPENYQSVALPNGQILIAGGDDGSNAFSNAYIYDPSAQTVTPTTSMNQARTQFTLTLLNSGQVLAVGGSDVWVNTGNLSSGGGSETLSSAEIYDPPSKTWTEAAPMSVARLAHTATLMPDGTVMIVGGLTDNSSSSGYTLAQDYEFFTPPTGGESEGSWAPNSISLSSVPRFNHSAVLLDDGTVLVVGGEATASPSATIPAPVHYFPGSNFWSTVQPEKTPRYRDAVTKLADGEVLVAGGINSSGSLLNTAETFNPSGSVWTAVTGTLPNAASGQVATLMRDGRVIIAGGTSSTVATFDYSTSQFTAGGTLPSNAFSGAGSTALVVQTAFNVLPVGAGPGIATPAATPQSVVPNVPYASVKVCIPGTAQCRVVDGIVVDTGSSGLRLFASKLQFPETSVAGFTPISTTSGGQLGECFPFVGSVAWGPVADADIDMGGEVAKSVPFQIIDDTGSFSSIPVECSKLEPAVLSSPFAPAAGCNGILGVGPSPNDNGAEQYYSCSNGSCTAYLLPVVNSPVVVNPVTAIHNAVFDKTSTDYNGIGLTMNSVPLGGQAADYGNLTFGIGTESNNNPSSTVQVFLGNPNDTFADAILTKFGNATIEGYLDSGTNAYAFDSPSNAPITQCPSNAPPNGPWYCPATPVSTSAINEGSASTPVSTPVPFIIGNASQLIQNGVYALPEVGGPLVNGLFDWGLPFFYGRTIYVGIDGESAFINSTCGTCTSTPCSCAGPFFAY